MTSLEDAALTATRDELLTVKQFAFMVGEHPQSVYRRIRENRQPGVIRIGGDIRIVRHVAMLMADV